MKLTTFLLVATTLTVTQKASAQTAAFVMSSVGMIANTSSNVAAVNFKSSATCLDVQSGVCLLYTSPSPRDRTRSRMPSSA